MDNAQSAQNNWRKMKQQQRQQQRQQQQQRTNTNKQYKNDEISLLNYFDWIIMIRDRWLAFYFPFVCCSCTRNVNSDSITLEI